MNLALLNPIERFSGRVCVVQATKKEEESCSFLDAIGRRSCGPLSRLTKNREVGKSKLRLKRIETAGRYATVRFDTLLWRDMHFNSRSSLSCLSSACMSLGMLLKAKFTPAVSSVQVQVMTLPPPPPPPSLSLSLSVSVSPCDQIREKESLPLNTTIRTSKRKFAKRGHQVQVSHSQHAVADSKKKKAELFPATSSCVLWISNDLRRVAALGKCMLSDATFVHSVWHFGCNKATKTKQWRRVGQSGRSGFMSTALWQYLLTMSTCLSMIQPVLQQTTNIWKIPAQTDLTCSGMLLQLCSGSDLRFCWSVPRSGAVSGWSLLPLCQKATKERTEDCSTAASQSGCVHLRSIKRARYATKHLRDTDSDYVMEKPSRCWLGAVPRYWKVVASCFQIVSFAENTSVPLAPRARISQPILLLFFFVFLLLNLSTKRCLRFFLFRL